MADGDTITVLHDQQPLRIRLQGVDCPEGGQAFGNVAKRFTSDMVFGKDVTITPTDRDRYGRTVAGISVGGRDLSLALVQAGLAWHFTRYSSDQRLAAAEREAREAHRGLWQDANPDPTMGVSASGAARKDLWPGGLPRQPPEPGRPWPAVSVLQLQELRHGVREP